MGSSQGGGNKARLFLCGESAFADVAGDGTTICCLRIDRVFLLWRLGDSEGSDMLSRCLENDWQVKIMVVPLLLLLC